MPKIKLYYLNLGGIMKKDRMIKRKIYRDNGNYVIDLHNFHSKRGNRFYWSYNTSLLLYQ